MKTTYSLKNTHQINKLDAVEFLALYFTLGMLNNGNHISKVKVMFSKSLKNKQKELASNIIDKICDIHIKSNTSV